MTQPSRTPSGQPTPPRTTLPAILSALAVIGVLVILLVVLLTNQRGVSTQTGSAALPTSTGAETLPTGEAISAPSAAPDGQTSTKKTYSAAPAMSIDATKNYTATITTPRGDIVIKLRPDLAPETVNSFVFLSREGFYDGLSWHRVIPGFVAQGGDPRGDGTGGPGYTIPDEYTNTVLFDKPGIVAMASTGAGTNSGGSQFFITLAPTPNLNSQYTIFGEVVQGQDIVDGIPERDPAAATTPGEQIVKITITES